MRSRLSKIISGALLALALGGPARAHPPEISLREKVSQADVVALVHVRSKSSFPRSSDPLLDRRAILRVVTSYKGQVEGTEITVAYGPSEECRETAFEVNGCRLVFLRRIRRGMYRTVSCHYGQMRPWESLLERVRALTGPGTMIGSPLRSGEPLVLVPSELSPKAWGSLRIAGLAPGMSEMEVRAAAGRPDRTAHAGRWWYWSGTDVRVRFDGRRNVDLLEGPVLGLQATPLLRYLDQSEAALALGQPYAGQGSWKFYQKQGRFVAVRTRQDRLTRFCMTLADQPLRAYVNSLAPPTKKLEPGPGPVGDNH